MEVKDLQQRIYEIRGKRVMLDFDLAGLYEVETKVLNQAVKRNADRFPPDFMFQLDFTEYHSLRSQIVTLENEGKGKHSKYAPFAFTEHGVTMLASALRSKKAIQMNIAIVRAFIILKEHVLQSGDIAAQLKEIQQRLTEHDVQLSQIYDAIENLLDDKAAVTSWKNRERIGFKTNPSSPNT